MRCNRYPSHLLLGNIVIRTTNMAYARFVEAKAKVELAERHVTSGAVDIDGLRITWAGLSQRKGNQP